MFELAMIQEYLTAGILIFVGFGVLMAMIRQKWGLGLLILGACALIFALF